MIRKIFFVKPMMKLNEKQRYCIRIPVKTMPQSDFKAYRSKCLIPISHNWVR